MRVLVACEYSGAVRDAFTRAGHDAWSCDLLPSDAPGKHYQGDVRDILPGGDLNGMFPKWDLMIAHPPCTYLCRAGQRWLNAPDDSRPGKLKGAPRWEAVEEAVELFQLLQEADIPRIAVENPRPGSHVADRIGKPDQVVQPWMFGHTENKATGLWLKNLPQLEPTDDVRKLMADMPKSETDKVHRASPGPDRWKIRSTTFTGLAAAMAAQWGVL